MGNPNPFLSFLGGPPLKGTGRVEDYFPEQVDLSYLYPQQGQQRIPQVDAPGWQNQQQANQAVYDEQQALPKIRALNPNDPDYGNKVLSIYAQHPLAEQSPVINRHLQWVSKLATPEFSPYDIHDPDLRNQYLERSKDMNWKENKAKYEEDLGYKQNKLKLLSAGLPLPQDGKQPNDEYVADLLGKVSHLKPMSEKETEKVEKMVRDTNVVDHDSLLAFLKENTHKNGDYTQEEIDDAIKNIKYQRSVDVQSYLQDRASNAVNVDPRYAERFKVEVPHLSYKKGIIESPPVPQGKTKDIPKPSQMIADEDSPKPWQEVLARGKFMDLARSIVGPEKFQDVMDQISTKPKLKEGGGYDASDFNRYVEDSDSAIKSLVVNSLPGIDPRITSSLTKKLDNPRTKVSFHDLMGFLNGVQAQGKGGLLPVPASDQKELLEKERKYLDANDGFIPRSDIEAYKSINKKATDEEAKKALTDEYTQDMKSMARLAAHNFWIMDDDMMSHLGVKRPAFKVQMGKNKAYQLIRDADPDLAKEITGESQSTEEHGSTKEIGTSPKYDPNLTMEENEAIHSEQQKRKEVAEAWTEPGNKLEKDLVDKFGKEGVRSLYKSILSNEKTLREGQPMMADQFDDPHETWSEKALKRIGKNPNSDGSEYGLKATGWLGSPKTNLDLIHALAQERMKNPRSEGNIGKPVVGQVSVSTPVEVKP